MSLCHFQQIFRPVEVMVRNIPSCSLVKVGVPSGLMILMPSMPSMPSLQLRFMAEIDELFKMLFVDVKILNPGGVTVE